MNVYGWLKQTAGPHHWAQPAYKSVCVYCRRRERSAGYCGCSLALAKRGPQFQEFSAPDENKAVAIFRRSLPRSFILGGGSSEKERERVCEIKCSSFGAAGCTEHKATVCLFCCAANHGYNY
jgi:hypothetical protein